ncbi:hypothetical protein UPYG_G00215210 [Umbra pygmaea]|uniref:Death ligand signal enhancer n=1 Tax=Umbra pygmaea TaxID=75934 RepID=A0ABD0WQV0_UMBPY
MWRIQGFVGRVLSRCHGNSPLRLSQNPHVEDFNTPTVISTGQHLPENSSQKGDDDNKRRKQRTWEFCYTGLPRYTAVDAVGWGAAAVLLMQICRRIHSQFSGPEPNAGTLATQGTLQKCGYHVLLEKLTRRDILPRGRSVTRLSQNQQTEEQRSSSNDSSPDHPPDHQLYYDHLHADSLFSNHQGAALSHDSSGTEELSEFFLPADLHSTREEEQPQSDHLDSLEGSAERLQQVSDSSVPVVLNIMGLQSARAGDYEAAFSCFLVSARQGYCKAQFNTAVCYEKGRGVCKDQEKAHHFYRQAAAGGHSQAQYCCAKLLLRSSRGQQSAQRDLDTAISLLQQAASSGLTEAQVYLGSLFTQEPVRDGRKSVHYLKMAAEGGNSEALLFLGQCYESGFGVTQCFQTAVRFYKRAAQAGNSQAKKLLAPPCGVEEEAVLRSIRSSPCFSDHLRRTLSTVTSPVPPPGHPTLPFPHSWSTGSLFPTAAIPDLHLHQSTPSSDRHPVGWTIGVG